MDNSLCVSAERALQADLEDVSTGECGEANRSSNLDGDRECTENVSAFAEFGG